MSNRSERMYLVFLRTRRPRVCDGKRSELGGGGDRGYPLPLAAVSVGRVFFSKWYRSITRSFRKIRTCSGSSPMCKISHYFFVSKNKNFVRNFREIFSSDKTIIEKLIQSLKPSQFITNTKIALWTLLHKQKYVVSNFFEYF